MKKTTDERIVAIGLTVLILVLAGGLGWTFTGAGDSTCCSDRSIMTKGIQAAHAALQKGDADRAVYVLEETAKITGIDLP